MGTTRGRESITVVTDDRDALVRRLERAITPEPGALDVARAMSPDRTAPERRPTPLPQRVRMADLPIPAPLRNFVRSPTADPSGSAEAVMAIDRVLGAEPSSRCTVLREVPVRLPARRPAEVPLTLADIDPDDERQIDAWDQQEDARADARVRTVTADLKARGILDAQGSSAQEGSSARHARRIHHRPHHGARVRPVMIVFAGPPGSGKSTAFPVSQLLRSREAPQRRPPARWRHDSASPNRRCPRRYAT